MSYVLTQDGEILTEFMAEARTSMMLSLVEKRNQLNDDIVSIRDNIPEFTGVHDLGNGSIVYPVNEVPQPTNDLEIYYYVDGGYLLSEPAQEVRRRWAQRELPLVEAKANVIAKYYPLKTEINRNTEKMLATAGNITLESFIMQSVNAEKAFSFGATSFEFILSSGDVYEMPQEDFADTRVDFSLDYYNLSEARDAQIQAVEDCTTHEDLVTLWETLKTEIGLQ